MNASRLPWWLISVVLGGVILAGAFYLDAAAHQWMMEHQTRAMRSFMRNVSAWGDWPSHVLLGTLAGTIAYFRRNRRWMRICVAMIVACAIAGAVTRVVKIAAGRARPSVEVDAGFNGPRFDSKYHAFPSGHTSSSTAFFAVLAFVNLRLAAALLPIPLLIAFSRMYVGAHYLSDVVGAILIGIAVAFALSRWRLFELAASRD